MSANVEYIDEAYYPALRLGSQYASFMKATAQGTDISVYYQDHFTKLNQVRFVAKDHRWESSAIDTEGIKAMPGTSLAVVNWGESIRLYYITVDWHVAEVGSDDDGAKWYNGTLTTKNIVAHPESGIAAVYDRSGKKEGQQGINIQVFFQGTDLNIKTTSYDAGWPAATNMFTADGNDPLSAMLGSSLAFANIGTNSEPRYVGFYQTDHGIVQELSFTSGKWGQGLTNARIEFDDTTFRTPLSCSALHYDKKNTLQLVYVKDGSVYHDEWEEGKGWGEKPLLAMPAEYYVAKAGITVSTRTFSAGGIKCHMYTTSPPNGIGSSVLQGDKWAGWGGVIALGTKHTIKARKNKPTPPAPPPAGQTVDAVYYEGMRPRSKFASIILWNKPNQRRDCVFYQAPDSSIIMNQYNESTKAWTETTIVPKGEARTGTPLTANESGEGYSGADAISIFFVTPDNKLASWYTGYEGQGVWKKDVITGQPEVHPLTDLCIVKGGQTGYDFLFYQEPSGRICEIARMGDWFQQETSMPALPGTAIAAVDRADGKVAYRYFKSVVYQDTDGVVREMTTRKDSQYDYHEWEVTNGFSIPLENTRFMSPMSCSVQRDRDGKVTQTLFYVDEEGCVRRMMYADGKGWSKADPKDTLVDWKLPNGANISATPKYWYDPDDTPARLYVGAPLNAVAEVVNGGASGFGPKGYGANFVPVGGNQVKVKTKI